MKRFAVIICSVAIFCGLLPVSSIVASADDVSTDRNSPVYISATSFQDSTDYKEYIKEYTDTNASTDVVLRAIDAILPENSSVVHEDNGITWNTQSAEASWKVTIPESGCYTVAFTYTGKEGGGSDIEIGLKVDEKYPYTEAGRFILPRTWVNNGENRSDNKGNEFAPEQTEAFITQKAPMRDMNGFVHEDLCVYLKKGTHLLSIVSYGEPFALHEIHLGVPKELLPYDEQLAVWQKSGVTKYDGEEFPVEGETAVYKTDRSLIGLSENNNPGVLPSDAFVQKVNYIGGSNWSMPDETLTWIVDAPSDGLYKLGFHFRQNYLVNSSCYRSLKINGTAQYQEQEYLQFDYKNGWQFIDQTAHGKDLLVYLKKGKNEVSLSVTLGKMNEYSEKMGSLILQLGDMYRDIVAIVGEKPDGERDYDLFKRIPNLEERMTKLNNIILSMIKERRNENKNFDDSSAMLKKMSVTLEKMLKYQYKAQKYKSYYYDCYSSLAAWLQEMKKMALDIDTLVFFAPEKQSNRTTAGFLSKVSFGLKRFISSFLLDYNIEGMASGKESLTLWVNWSRDQTLVLNSLINSKFTSETGISVTIRMTNASLLQGILSGNGPDCALSEARTTPINLAMRGCLVDLSQFEDYEEITKRFSHNASLPYIYRGGVFALPSTQQFYMLFYRTDVLEEMALTVPKTWDEFVDVASVLMLHNMQVGLPYTELKDIYQTNSGVASLNIFPTLVQQHGLSLYNKDFTGTSMATPETIQVFEKWTNFYTRYSMPKEYSFFNRFRVGLMPLAVQPYTQYSVLTAAAPEINGRWQMTEIPGVMDQSGKINNSQAGFGTGSVILNTSQNKEAAWELLKWWTSESTQYSYSTDIEAILGVAGRYTSANMNACLKLDWNTSARSSLLSQWNKLREIEEVPGGYYVSRAVDQAFWNVVNNNGNYKDMMIKWGEIADEEIKTKIAQYDKEASK